MYRYNPFAFKKISKVYYSPGTPVQGSVTTYADLPAAVPGNSGLMYYVNENSGGSWVRNLFSYYQYPKGFYISDGSSWTKAEMQVKVSEDAKSIVNINDWAAEISTDPSYNIGDRVIYNDRVYVNITGTFTSTTPELDTTNWRYPIDNTLQLDTTYTGNPTEPGTFKWNPDENTIDVVLPNGVVGQMFQEEFFDTINQTGLDLSNGIPVMFGGTVGASGKIKIIPAIANGTYLAAYIIGIITEDILNGNSGKVTWFGKVRNVNTTGINFPLTAGTFNIGTTYTILTVGTTDFTLIGAADNNIGTEFTATGVGTGTGTAWEVWYDGAVLYVSPYTEGYLTVVEPAAPNQIISVGAVINAHSNGTIIVRPTWGDTLTRLNDVNGTPLTTDKQLLVYNLANGYHDFSEVYGEFGDKAGGNYATFNENGELRLYGDATQWDDLRFPVLNTKLGGSKDPNFTKVFDNGAGSQGVFTYLFDPSSEEELYFIAQMPHNWMQGSTLEAHVHWLGQTDGAAGADVCWGLEYTWSNIGSVFGNTTIIYGDTNHLSEDIVANKQYLTELGNIDATGKTFSSVLICRVFRDATGVGGTDDYAYDAALLEIDFHYQLDSLGSNEEYVKY